MKAFTLAEVLIMLSVISVIAALTIPKIINTAQVEENRLKLNMIQDAFEHHFDAEHTNGAA